MTTHAALVRSSYRSASTGGNSDGDDAADVDRAADPGAAQPEPHVEANGVVARRIAAHVDREAWCICLGVDRVAPAEPPLLDGEPGVRVEIENEIRVLGDGEAAID